LSRSLEITIPMLVPRMLSPNRSRLVHWGAVTRAKTKLQQAVYIHTLVAKDRYRMDYDREWEPLDKALLTYTFYVKDWRSVMDDDNVIAAWKFGQDILQANTKGKVAGTSIVTNDSGLTVKQIIWKKNKERSPETVILVEAFT
jgi:hypothetical protein